MRIIDGRKISEELLGHLRVRVRLLRANKKIPTCGILLVGHHPSSKVYVEKKRKAGESIGIHMMIRRLPASTSHKHTLRALHELCEKAHGVIVQLPLPKHMNTQEVLEAIPPAKDIDCLTSKNLGNILLGSSSLVPPTSGAILEVLKRVSPSVRGKYIVLLGAGRLVGKPLLPLLLEKGATVTVCQSATKNFSSYTKKADIVITGVGKANILRGQHIRRGVVVIDAGISVEDGDVRGDIHAASIAKKAKYYTPTPGGVGPLTVVKLLENVVRVAEDAYQSKKHL